MTFVAFDRTLGVLWIEVLRHLWQTALVLLPLFFLARVLRSAPARWSHRLWVAALVKLFVPLALFGPLAASLLQRLTASDATAPQGTALDGFRVFITATGAGHAAARFPAPFWTLCTAAYLVIASWLIARTVRDLGAAWRLAHADAPIEGERRVRLDSAIALAGIPRDRVRVADANVIPSLVGTTRPRIVLPLLLLDALDAEELAAVLLHEEMHRRNGDAALSVVQRLTSALVFFFPLLGPLQRRLREAAELRCDEDALRAGADPGAYVRALAGTIRLGLEPSPAPAALGDGNLSLIGKRLARMAEPRRAEIMTKHRVAIATAAVILAAGIFLPIAPVNVLAGSETSNDLTVERPATPLVPGEGVTMPTLLTRVEPVYPQDARDARIGGSVILQAVIREDGTVSDVQVLSNESGLPSLAESATTAVSQRVYSPAIKDGKPVSIYFTVKVEYSLGDADDKKSEAAEL